MACDGYCIEVQEPTHCYTVVPKHTKVLLPRSMAKLKENQGYSWNYTFLSIQHCSAVRSFYCPEQPVTGEQNGLYLQDTKMSGRNVMRLAKHWNGPEL